MSEDANNNEEQGGGFLKGAAKMGGAHLPLRIFSMLAENIPVIKAKEEGQGWQDYLKWGLVASAMGAVTAGIGFVISCLVGYKDLRNSEPTKKGVELVDKVSGSNWASEYYDPLYQEVRGQIRAMRVLEKMLGDGNLHDVASLENTRNRLRDIVVENQTDDKFLSFVLKTLVKTGGQTAGLGSAEIKDQILKLVASSSEQQPEISSS